MSNQNPPTTETVLRVKKSDIEGILKGAAVLEARGLYDKAMQSLSEIGREDIPIEELYGLGIPREYIDRFLAVYSPSKEQQLKTINELGAIPDKRTILRVYERILLDELRTKFPNENFEFWGNSSNFPSMNLYRVTTGYKKGVLRKRIVEKQEVAKFNFGSLKGAVIEIRDPSFAEACKDKLIKLKERFSHFFEEYKVVCDYLYRLED